MAYLLVFVSNIVITINGSTDRNTILFITIRIILQRMSNSQTQRFCLDNLSDFISKMAYNKLLQTLVVAGISAE